VLGLVMFVGLIVFNLPTTDRFLFLTSAALALLCSFAALGWGAHRALPWRGLWAVWGVAIIAALVVGAPRQTDRLRSLGRWSANEARLFTDTRALARGPLSRTPLARCGRIYAPSSRAVPYFAYFLHRRPADIGLADIDVPRKGVLVAPATALANTLGVSDLREPNVHTTVPPGFTLVAANRSWRVYAAGCATAAS
jgi:hypothetical protein